MKALPVVAAEIVHMDKHTFMWVRVTHFALGSHDDQSAIAALIESPGYAHDYASPFHIVQHPHPSYGPVHGRWWLGAIHPGCFEATTADVAERLIQTWAEDQDWTPEYHQPADALRRLQPVYGLLRTGNLYHLVNPSDEEIHDYGQSTGNLGFHEFVVIDSNSGQIHVVVASDD